MDPDRCFTAGSRPAPDPHDQYLEREKFYRKHTPRDSSSLFRCISEQLFDTQRYYRRIRDECCAYMRRNQEYFESHVDGCFEDYMQNMSGWRARGTLLELRALAYRYKRNVILFEPFTLGQPFIQQPQYGDSTFQVFVAPDYHFDSVFTKSEIEDAAFCQSIVYESLYKDVFQLPDVNYAVERMLHDQLGERLTVVEELRDSSDDEREEDKKEEDVKKPKNHLQIAAITEDGREFVFDTKEATKCILEDFQMCHFHNEEFDSYLDGINGAGDRANIEQKDNNNNNNNHIEGGEIKRDVDSDSPILDQQIVPYQAQPHLPSRRREDSMLKVADVSCVRQLLNDGITPFPYKVAKALDPHIYRNIEFDVWSDQRKMSYSNRFLYRRFITVGDKCFVRLNSNYINYKNNSTDSEVAVRDKAGGDFSVEKSNNYSAKVYVGYVQHVERFTNMYHVYVEELREKLIVHGNTVQSWTNQNNNNHQWMGNSRNYTVMGLNSGGGGGYGWNGGPPRMPFNNSHHNYINKYRGGSVKQFAHRPSTGYFHSSTPYAPRPYLNRHASPGGAYPGTYRGGMIRNGSFYRHPLNAFPYNDRGRRGFCHQQNYRQQGNYKMNNYNNRQNSHSINEADHHNDNEDAYLLKKQAAADESSPLACADNKITDLNLKELLCTSFYYAESAKYFQCHQNIIAMPAFITGQDSPSNDGNEVDDEQEQRRNKENLKRDEPNNVIAVGGATTVIEFGAETSPEESQNPTEIVEDDAIALNKMGEEQLSFDQQQQQYSHQQFIADPNALYATTATGGQYYTAVTSVCDTTAAGAYYQPCYRSGTSAAVAGGTCSTVGPSYYCNYVYNNATGAMQTVTPYLVGTGSAAVPSNAAYLAPATFDGPVIPFQNAIRRRDVFYSDQPVNVNAAPSFSPKGNDLPMNDVPSLRFFYNLGVEYFTYMASTQGATNTLNMLQQFPGASSEFASTTPTTMVATTTTPPVTANSPNFSAVSEISQEMRAMTIAPGSNKRNNSTSSTNEVGGSAGTTRNSTPSSTGADATTGVSGGGNSSHNIHSSNQNGRSFQGPGFRRPPFNNHNNNPRGAYNRPNHHFNNYRGGMHQQSSFSSAAAQDKGKDIRGPNNYYFNNYGYAYNRRHNGPGGGGRFNYNGGGNNNGNNPNLAHRKPGGNVSAQDGNRNSTAEENNNKNQSQSPFAGNQNQGNQQQSSSPAIGGAKLHFNDATAGHQQLQQHQQQHGGAEEANNHQTFLETGPPTATMNYYGSGAPQFAFSGPPPHLPPPFGGNSANNTQGAVNMNQGQQQLLSIAPNGQTGAAALQPVYNPPIYTYAYYPVEMTGNMGLMSAGDAANQGSNMVIQSMQYMPQANPYQNQHLANGQQFQQQIATPTNGQLYYTSNAGEPGTPIMQTYPMLPESIPWSSTTGGTPNAHSGPSSGIGSTESSPPYGSAGTNHNVQGQGVLYANQSPAYNYSYPPPAPQPQQQFWYPAQQQQSGGPGAAATNGGGGSVVAKGEGKP